MKRVLIVAILVALSVLSVSCNKEDDTRLDDRLVGTKWQARNAIADAIFTGNHSNYLVYEFISATEVERYATRDGSVSYTDGVFQYTLDYPKITIHAKSNVSDDDTEHFTFTDSSTMVRDGTDGSGLANTYYKQ